MKTKSTSGTELTREVPEVLRDNIGFLLNKAARIVRDDVAEELKEVGFSLNEYGLLRMLELRTTDTQQELGERLGVDRTSMVGIVDRLEKRGLVERVRDRSDRRKYNLLLTDKGRKSLIRARKRADQAQKAIFATLKEKQQTELKTLLLHFLIQYYEHRDS